VTLQTVVFVCVFGESDGNHCSPKLSVRDLSRSLRSGVGCSRACEWNRLGYLMVVSVGVTLRNAKLNSSLSPGLWSQLYIPFQTSRRARSAPQIGMEYFHCILSLCSYVVRSRAEFLAIFLDLCAEIDTFLIWEGKKSWFIALFL
jgi:hypothetical protein